MNGMRIPGDLRGLPLTLDQAERVIKDRQRVAALKTRLAKLPLRAQELKDEIAQLVAGEKAFLAEIAGEVPTPEGGDAR